METEKPSGSEADPATGLRLRDPRVVDALYRRYAGPLFSFALRFLGSRAEAEDALHETWAAALRAGPAFRGDAPVSTWLFGIARRKCLERIRSSRRLRPAGDDLPEPVPPAGGLSDPERSLERKLDARRLERALAALPDDFREILLLRDVQDLPYEEVASILAIPLGTVRSRLSRARWALRERLGEESFP